MIRFAALWVLLLLLAVPLQAQRGVKPINTFADLAAANTSDVNTNAFLVGGTFPNDGYQGIFTYIASSSAAAVSNAVIVPNNGIGRWFRQTISSNTTFANPTALVGLTPINGASTNTVMRSDAAPALSQAIVPTWTGFHTFNQAAKFSAGGLPLTIGSLTNVLRIDGAGGGDYPIRALSISNTAAGFTAGMIQAQTSIDYAKDATTIIVFDGDSLNSDAVTRWSHEFLANHKDYSKFTPFYKSVPGSTVADAVIRYPTNVAPVVVAGQSKRIYSLRSGINDLAAGRTANAIYADMQTCWSMAWTNGFNDVWAWTVMPSTNVTGTNETARLALNSFILSDPSLYSAVIDIAKVMTTATNTTYFEDGTHPTQAGADVEAQTVWNSVGRRTFYGVPISGGSFNTNATNIALTLGSPNGFVRIAGNMAIGRTPFTLGREFGALRMDADGGSAQPFEFYNTSDNLTGIRAGQSSIGTTSFAPASGLVIGGVMRGEAVGTPSIGDDLNHHRIDSAGTAPYIFRFWSSSNALAGIYASALKAATITADTYPDITPGMLVNGAATSGLYLRGDGAKIVLSPLAANEIATGLVPTARLGNSVADATTFLRGDSTWAVPPTGGGTGTVTSVAMTVPSILSVAGSPITTSGTLAVTLATETANTLFAGPTSGGAAAPTFRTMVGADIPDALIVATTKLSATGTKDSTTFLRGDDTWAIPSGGSGTFFANPSASIGLSAINGSDTNAMRADAAPALSQAIIPTWTGTHTFRKTTTPVQIQYDSTHGLAIAVDSAGTPSFTSTTGTNAFVGIADASAGFTVASAATSASYLRGDGTKGVFAPLSASDLAAGTVPTTRLGSGVANSSTFLRGDNTWAVPSGGSGTFFADPTASVGTSAINGTSTNAMRADAAPAINQAMAPTWTGLHIFRNTVVPVSIQYDAGNFTTLVTGSGGEFTITPTGNEVNLQGRVDASVGFKVGNAAASGSYIRGNGTEGVFAALSASDLATGTVPTARLGSGAAGATTFLRGDQTWNTAVTSVGLSLPAEFTVSGSPVTTSGTLSASKATQNANTVWAGPTSGSAAQPTFRALTRADVVGTGGGFGITYRGATVDLKSAANTETDIWTNTFGTPFIMTGLGILTTNMTGAESASLPQFAIGSSTGAPLAYFAAISLDEGTNNFYQVWTVGISSSTAESMPLVAATSGTLRLKMLQPSDATTRSAIFYIHGFYPPSD